MLAKTKSELELNVRIADQQDTGYCMASATRSIRAAAHLKNITDIKELKRLDYCVRNSWDHASTKLIATLPDDDYLIVGMIWGEPDVPLISYLHVRGEFRGLGVATYMASLFGVEHGTEAAVGFPTWDLCRYEAGDSMPIGLLYNKNYKLTLLIPELK